MDVVRSLVSINPSSNPTTGTTGSGGTTHFGVQTKTSGCQAHNGLQDFACTPGAILSTGTKDAICKSGYAKSVRNVPDSEKNEVYAEYGITSHAPGQYEVDHLVSLELGGSNEIANFWPELASPKPGFHEKDKVENYLHAQVCSGAVSLQQAQQEIATNWLRFRIRCRINDPWLHKMIMMTERVTRADKSRWAR